MELTRVSVFKYLGVLLSDSMCWSHQIDATFHKVRNLSFYALRLRSLTVPPDVISLFVFSCIVPHMLYCSPVVFPGLLAKDFLALKRCIKVISRLSGVSQKAIREYVVEKHFNACDRLAGIISSDNAHPLHEDMMACRSASSTRSVFRLPYTRTNKFKNSFLPYIIKLQNNKYTSVSELLLKLSN